MAEGYDLHHEKVHHQARWSKHLWQSWLSGSDEPHQRRLLRLGSRVSCAILNAKVARRKYNITVYTQLIVLSHYLIAYQSNP